MSASKAWTDWWLPLRMSSSVMKPNQRSTWLIQLELVGDEMHVEAWLFDQPSVDRRRLVSAVVVTDQVHFQVVGDFVVNLGQELLKLNHSMPPVDRGDDGPVGDVERGEQAGHAAAQIVVDAPLGHHRQHGAGTSQRLDLKLLVDAQHYRALAGIQVEVDDVVDLLHEQRVLGQLEPIDPVRLELKAFQIRPIVVLDNPERLAIDARDQCVAFCNRTSAGPSATGARCGDNQRFEIVQHRPYRFH